MHMRMRMSMCFVSGVVCCVRYAVQCRGCVCVGVGHVYGDRRHGSGDRSGAQPNL